MRLILEYETGSHDTYMRHVEPVLYESKEKFLEDFSEEWKTCTSKDVYEYQTFKVGQKEFDHEDHRTFKFKDDLPKYCDYENQDNYYFEIKFPEVYTVDEWFSEVENV